MLVWTGVVVWDLMHSRFGDIQLEGLTGVNLKIPDKSSIEVWEERGVGVNNVS